MWSRKILKAGSRLFDEANLSDKIASKRREQRGRRRNLRRKITWKQDLINLFVKYNFLQKENDFYELDFNFDLLELRKKAINSKIELEQLLIILFNYIKHRGSFNYREDLSELKNISQEELETSSEFKLPVDIQFELKEENNKFREINNEKSLINHEWYVKEINLILDAQIENKLINLDFKKDYLKLFNRKREYYDGPGPKDKNLLNPSKYGWKNQEEFFDRFAGKDTYDSKEQRAPKHSLTSYLFNILNDLNNLSINGDRNQLTYENKKDLINLTLINQKEKAENITLKKIAKYLKINEKNITGYRLKPNSNESIFTVFESANKMRSILVKNNKSIDFICLENIDKIDKIVDILTKYQSIEDKSLKLEELNFDFFDKETCEKLAVISLTGTHALSKKTMSKLIEEMFHDNLNHMEALAKLKIKPDYKLKVDLTNFKTIPILREKINEMYISPVVKRALIESLKIIKELERHFKDFEIKDIVIEMAKKNSAEKKQFISKIQRQNVDLVKKLSNDYSLDENKLNFKMKEKFLLLSEQ
nr:type II CRISPR RNA-guided endonuclease Cas9 [Spiroplasma taiwanense]